MKDKYRIACIGDKLGGMAVAFEKNGFCADYQILFSYEYENIVRCNTECAVLEGAYVMLENLPEVDVIAGQLTEGIYKAGKVTGFGWRNAAHYVDKLRPKCFCMEAFERFRAEKGYDALISDMKKVGYSVLSQVMDSYESAGKPVKRKRLYIIGLRGDLSGKFSFPMAQEQRITLTDILEEKVAGKYYIDSEKYEERFREKGVYTWVNGEYRLSDYVNYHMNQPKIRDSYGVRNLTLRESARLKGFPDAYNWENEQSERLLCRTIGQSPDIDICSMLAKQIREFLITSNVEGSAKPKKKIVVKTSEKVAVKPVMYNGMEKNVERRFDVFVSSTYEDLIEERKEVTQAILECGCVPVGMEMFPASNLEQWNFIKKVIDSSDFYLVISAGKYGSVGTSDAGVQMSYTEMEFDYALSINKPILVFLFKDLSELKSGKVDLDEAKRIARDRFREKVKKGRLVQFYTNKDDLKAKVLLSLSNLKKQIHTGGWIRESESVFMADESVRKQIQNLESEKAELSRRIQRSEDAIKMLRHDKEKYAEQVRKMREVIEDFEMKIKQIRLE